MKIEFWAVYDIRGLGELPFNLFKSDKVKVRFIQWTEDVYAEVIFADGYWYCPKPDTPQR